MRVADLRLMFKHDRWATERLLAAAEALPDEWFTAPGAGGHAPLRETLLHSLNAQQNWRHRAQRRPRPTPVAEEIVLSLNHGTQHRSEVAETLTLLGRSPGGLDVGSFLFERAVIHPVAGSIA